MTPEKATAAKPPAPPAVGAAGRAVAGAVISSFLFGYSICVLNSCGGLIAVTFQWCGNDWQSDCMASKGSQGMVNASVYLGAAIGALMMGRPYVFALGSRVQLVISAAYFAAGAIICALSQGVGTLVVGRFASGLGLGISAIAGPLYIAEISPRERRGINSAMHGVFITLGILASIAFGIPQSPPPADAQHPLAGLDSWYWRFLLGLPCVLAAVQMLLFTVVHPLDSPSLLVTRGQIRNARSVLYRIYGISCPSAPDKLDMNDEKQVALELQLKDLKEAVDMAKAVPRIKVIQAMCDPFLRTAVFLGAGLAAFQQLCGINGLMAYSNALFAEAGIQPQNLTLASTMMASANVLASVLSSRVVDRWGRRTLLFLGSLFQTLAMGCLTLATDPKYGKLLPEGSTGPVAVVCFTIFVQSFSFGLGAVTWLYLSEIYPMEIRGPSLSACGVINWLSSFVVVFGTSFLSLQGACHVFGLVCLVGCLMTWIYVVETKGCSMDDSPLTPKSRRFSSPLLTPTLSSPRGNYDKMEDEDEDSDEESVEHGAAKKA